MRLKWFCGHEYHPTGVDWGENLLGDVEWGVYFKCLKCLKTKIDKGYRTEQSARTALAQFKRRINK